MLECVLGIANSLQYFFLLEDVCGAVGRGIVSAALLLTYARMMSLQYRLP
jgi:hypothetical protein